MVSHWFFCLFSLRLSPGKSQCPDSLKISLWRLRLLTSDMDCTVPWRKQNGQQAANMKAFFQNTLGWRHHATLSKIMEVMKVNNDTYWRCLRTFTADSSNQRNHQTSCLNPPKASKRKTTKEKSLKVSWIQTTSSSRFALADTCGKTTILWPPRSIIPVTQGPWSKTWRCLQRPSWRSTWGELQI